MIQCAEEEALRFETWFLRGRLLEWDIWDLKAGVLKGCILNYIVTSTSGAYRLYLLLWGFCQSIWCTSLCLDHFALRNTFLNMNLFQHTLQNCFCQHPKHRLLNIYRTLCSISKQWYVFFCSYACLGLLSLEWIYSFSSSLFWRDERGLLLLNRFVLSNLSSREGKGFFFRSLGLSRLLGA